MATRFLPTASPATSTSQLPYGNAYQSPQGNMMRQRMGGPAPGPGAMQPQQRTGGGGVAGAPRRTERKDAKEVAWVHWRALKDFLAAWAEKESPTARASAREKLTRLTRLQFLELSTDVYDELMRRLTVERGGSGEAAPFLPVRDDFHPKRNQARQKLATLPKNRFRDLASDVFFELRRRYPEFETEKTMQMEPTYQAGPAYSAGPDGQAYISPTAESPYKQYPDTSYEEPPAPGPIYSNWPQASGGPQALSPTGTNRPTHHRKGSSLGSSTDRPTLAVATNGQDARDRYANLTAATNDVVVPNKSRLQEEEIEVPYARDSQEVTDGPAQSALRNVGGAGPSNLRELRSESRSSDHPANNAVSPQLTDEPYFDRMSFASNVTSTTRSKAVTGIVSPNGWEDMENKIRAEYELRIAGLERRLNVTEADRDEAQRAVSEEQERRKDYEDEVRGLKERSTTHASSLRSIQHELDISRDAADALRHQNEQTVRQLQDEVAQWRERCDGLEDEMRRLEEERSGQGNNNSRAIPTGGADTTMVAELQSEMRGLVQELNSLSIRNDELEAERERESEIVAALEAKVEEYHQQAKAARIELRNLKATSTLFVSQPLTNDHLPASPDGNIADVHVSAFQTAIDGLLTAARSSHPSGVLPAMKAIVESVTSIGEDVKAFEETPNLDVDVSKLESLKHESTTRLSGLMTAARNHAMASGLSPVSLIDAAAGHLSANVVDIIKLLKIRRSGHTRDILRKRSSMSIGEMVRRRSVIFGGDTPEEDDEPIVTPAPGSEEQRHAREAEQRMPAYSSTVSPPRGANLTAAPPSAYEAPVPQFRIHSFQSASSTGKRSDSFDLERKGSTASAASATEYGQSRSFAPPKALPRVPTVNVAAAEPAADPMVSPVQSLRSEVDAHMASPSSQYADQTGYGQYAPYDRSDSAAGGASTREWDDLKPYLNTQSSALVNAIQNLLAAIRTGGQGPALNEHLSEVIAISSSIVGVSSSALPDHFRSTGDPLLADLVSNTDRLSEAQQAASRAGGFDKALRQGIATASFGVAKALKALMKLGA